MGERTAKTQVTAPRRAIARPRLTQMLDASKARVILLIAPAGYGKTTLARQWFGTGERQVVWYRATQASADVAALAAGIARALATVVPGVADRLRELIRSSAAPARDVDEFTEAFLEELSAFPDGGWLVLDDYHFLVGSAPAERFVDILADRGPARLLIASRRRPRWATTRRILYGEVAEASQRDLAFTMQEAEQILPFVSPELLYDFVDRAKGWPAVLRLASLSGNRTLPELELPPELHEYFAEELFQAAAAEVQEALVRLSLLPTLRHELLALALGPNYVALCREAVALGFLTEEPGGVFEVHPLLRGFLSPRARQLPEAGALGERLVQALANERHWDEAFDAVVSLQRLDLLPALFEEALDDLLVESRISTLEAWVAHASQQGAEFPLLDLAEAEIARRLGSTDLGEVLAVQAARNLESTNRFCSRAWAVAGECAHLGVRPTDALVYHAQAELHARTSDDARRALWGRHVVEVQFEAEDAGKALERLRSLNDGTPSATIRVAAGELHLGMLTGPLQRVSQQFAQHRHLLPRVGDPLITTGFLNRLACVLIASGQYRQGMRAAEEAVREARRTRTTFAVVHLMPLLIAASIGLRRFRHAEILLDDLSERVERSTDGYERLNSHIFRVRFVLARHGSARALAGPDLKFEDDFLPPGLRLEAAALSALARAVSGDAERALADVDAALDKSADLQGTTIAILARFVQAEVTGDTRAEALLVEALDLLRLGENYDSLVCAYRAYPELLRIIAERHLMPHHTLESVIRNAIDLRLAASVGVQVSPPNRGPQWGLTRREGEVYALLCEGLTNREIAEALVISEPTAKVHVRHILDKLGVRTRAQAMRVAQETF